MIRAERTISAPPESVFAFLAHLPNHWQLEEALSDFESTGAATANVRLRGPLGIAREARTEVVEAVEHTRLRGRAVVGNTIARVGWDLRRAQETTHVALWTEIEHAAPVDRLLLALGGRWWLRRVYARALANLERALA